MVCAESVVVCPNRSPVYSNLSQVMLGKNVKSKVREVSYWMVGSVLRVCAERGVETGWEATTWGERALVNELRE